MYTENIYHSPCNKDCHIDPETHFCKGCFRTVDEIIRWPYSSDEEKEKIFRKIESRRKGPQKQKTT